MLGVRGTKAPFLLLVLVLVLLVCADCYKGGKESSLSNYKRKAKRRGLASQREAERERSDEFKKTRRATEKEEEEEEGRDKKGYEKKANLASSSVRQRVRKWEEIRNRLRGQYEDEDDEEDEEGEDEDEDEDEGEDEEEDKGQGQRERLRINSQSSRPPLGNAGDARLRITPWVEHFCSLPGNEFYLAVPKSFIEDPVTCAILSDALRGDESLLRDALRLMSAKKQDFDDGSGDTGGDSDFSASSNPASPALRSLARKAYDIIHSRFLTSAEGLAALRAKYEACGFGRCPRVHCRGFPLLPVGMHDAPNRSSLKVFCPLCREAYHPNNHNQSPSPKLSSATPSSMSFARMRAPPPVDGAAFGTTAAHLVLQRHIELAPVGSRERYTAKIFGHALDESNPTLRVWRGELEAADKLKDKSA